MCRGKCHLVQMIQNVKGGGGNDSQPFRKRHGKPSFWRARRDINKHIPAIVGVVSYDSKQISDNCQLSTSHLVSVFSWSERTLIRLCNMTFSKICITFRDGWHTSVVEDFNLRINNTIVHECGREKTFLQNVLSLLVELMCGICHKIPRL